MKEIIEIPADHKRVIDNLITDGKGHLLPHEVETRLAKAVKIGTVIPDNATNGDMIKALFPGCKDWKAKIEEDGGAYEVHFVQLPNSMTTNKYEESFWNAQYKR